MTSLSANYVSTPPLSDQEYYSSPAVVRFGREGEYACSIESATVAGDLNKPNEDCYAIRSVGTGLGIAIFDGATSLKKIPAHDSLGMSGARFASHFLRDCFLAIESFDEQTLSWLNRSLGARVADFEGLDPSDPTTVPTSTATIVMIDSDRDLVTLQHISDSFCIVKTKGGDVSLVTNDPLFDLEERLYKKISAIAKSQGVSNRVARNDPEVFAVLISELQRIHNAPNRNGAGVVNGDPVMDSYIQRREFKLSTLESLLLGSDGLPAPHYPLSAKENVGKLVDLVEAGGLRRAIAFKKQCEDQDPDWNCPRWKHSDDATGVHIVLSKS